jgi:hypothetical protein
VPMTTGLDGPRRYPFSRDLTSFRQRALSECAIHT